MKKILFIIPCLVGGGAERVMTTLANGLSKKYDVEILTLTHTDSFYQLAPEVRVSGLGSRVNKKNAITKLFTRVKSAFNGFFGIKRAIKRKKPDVVVSFLGPASCPLVLLKSLTSLKCRVVVSERADPNERGKIYRWFERNFFPKADVIVCQSTKAAEFFREKDRKKTVVIPNPICAEAIPPLFEGERTKRIVGVGRLDAQKNFPLLINAFSKLGDEFSDYKLEIYGAGFEKDNLQKQIDELGISDKAELMGVRKNVMFYVADASLYVMSSNYEGFPNALVEAMATGLPVISTDFPTGVAHEVIKEENGLVVPIRDEDAMVSAMRELLSDPERCKEMSRENRKYLDILNEESVISMWEKLF